MKVNRHAKIVELINKYQIETQDELAEYLNVPEGEPLFRLDGRYVDDDGRPLMTEKQIMVGSRYSIAL